MTAPAHRFLEHVAEAELVLEAPTEAGLFSAALDAFRELVDGRRTAGAPVEREIVLADRERTLLLADWLDELVFLAEVDGFVADRIETLALAADGLRATVVGRHSRPRHLVKAVTLDRLELERRERTWYAHVVLDV
jgi:SHS2 domain-containing protein